MPYILLLFIAMSIVEIALLLRVGDAFGWLPTLLIVIVTAFIGSAMLRQQGLATLNTARQRMDSGELPAQQLLEGVLIMIGGVLLLTPGLVTDACGFLCLIPFTRQWLAARISARVLVGVGGAGGTAGGGAGKRFHGRTSGTQRGPATPSSAGPSTSSGRRGTENGDIIDGDFTRIDDD